MSFLGAGGAEGGGLGGGPQFQNTLSPNVQRQRSLLRPGLTAEIGRRLSTSHNPFAKASYERVLEEPSLPPRSRAGSGSGAALGVPVIAVADEDDEEVETDMPSAVEFREGLFDALGVSTGGAAGGGGGRRGSWLPGSGSADTTSPWSIGLEEDFGPVSSTRGDDDRAPLADPRNVQPIAGSNLQPVASGGSMLSPPQFSSPFGGGGRLGDDLNVAEQGMGRSGSISRRKSLSPLAASPVRRLSVAVQSMSQRVVNLGNDPTAVEQNIRRRPSQRQGDERPILEAEDEPELEVNIPLGEEDPYEKPISPIGHKHMPHHPHIPHHPHMQHRDHLWRQEQANPLKGVSLRIFGPNNWLRVRLCGVLVHP